MFGHTHTDIFKVPALFEDETKVSGVITVCGSITTFIGVNPSYCVYTLDKQTLLPISRKTYSFDIDEANATGTPNWKLFTDWTNTYGMKNLSPTEYRKLSYRIQNDKDVATNYLHHMTRFPARHQVADDHT